MPDRLSELASQRALVSEHLAWLDREIAEETVKRLASGQAAPVPPSTSSVSVRPSTPPVATSAAAPSASLPTPATSPETEPEQLLDRYRVEPSTVKSDVRKGCLLYFAGAFLVLGIVIAILYFTIGSH